MLSRSELGIHIRGVISIGDVSTLVNLGLWRDIGHAVRLSAAPMTMAAPVAARDQRPERSVARRPGRSSGAGGMPTDGATHH